jgi:4-aminobutyrate aminotransferase/(S)-3-amino-2-methylpropionate transaminase
MPWPVAEFPRLKYPLASHESENAAEEQRCLEFLNKTFDDQLAQGKHITAVIVEPVQSEGGDFHATPVFFKGVQRICGERGAAFIVDEVQTGVGASGKMWAFEHWGLEHPPDMVTFSKKAQTGGYFYTDAWRANAPYRVFNTWMGDPAKVLLCGAIGDVIRKDDLLTNTKRAGQALLDVIQKESEKYPLKNVRGVGTIISFDCDTAAARDKIYAELRNRGCLVGLCGDRSIRFRPSLIFSPKHVEQFAPVFHESLEVVFG